MIAGLRKNLNVSKPSIGASFHAPPIAETQPAALPISSRIGSGSEAASRLAVQKASSRATAATPAATVQRRARSWTGLPNTANCIGIVYFDWSSSRTKVL